MRLLQCIPIALLVGMTTACRRDVRTDEFSQPNANALAAAIEMFALKNGSIPTTVQGLEILVTRPAPLPPGATWERALTKLPNDPWDRPFHYIPDCTAEPQKFQLISPGQDGVPSADDKVFSFTVKPRK